MRHGRLAGDGGFEPPHTDPESAVLPLDESPKQDEDTIPSSPPSNRMRALELSNHPTTASYSTNNTLSVNHTTQRCTQGERHDAR
jgi:hypothetical protein